MLSAASVTARADAGNAGGGGRLASALPGQRELLARDAAEKGNEREGSVVAEADILDRPRVGGLRLAPGEQRGFVRGERRLDAVRVRGDHHLDTEGEDALTFRALTTRLATGAGAIYWHVANKDELLAAATNEVIARVMTEVATGTEPRDVIRIIALGVSDTIDTHPFVHTVAAQLREHDDRAQFLAGIDLILAGIP